MTRGKNIQAQSAAASIRQTACGGRPDMWKAGEAAHVKPSTPEEATAAAAPFIALCVTCPAIAQCREWAQVEKYTGIAAGSAWIRGKERSVSWVHNQPVAPASTSGDENTSVNPKARPGRPYALSPTRQAELVELHRRGEKNQRELAILFEVDRRTVFRILQRASSDDPCRSNDKQKSA